MSHRHSTCLALLVALAWAAPCSAADDKANAVRIAIGYADPISCKVNFGVADIALANDWGSDSKLQKILSELFACRTLAAALKPATNQRAAENSVVMFLSKSKSGEASIVHVLYQPRKSRFASTTLQGAASLNWIYITETPGDTIVSQVTAPPTSNPILAQIGGLLSTIEKPYEKLDLTPHTLLLSVAANVGLTFRRSTITENDLVLRTVKDQKGADVPKLIPGSFGISNTPNTWITANAVVGATLGNAKGDQRMKIDSKTYASDPLPIGLTGAGVTLHVPFDPFSPGPTWQEVFGLYGGGVVTPGGGFSIGGSIGWRGIAFLFGSAWIRVQTAPNGLDVGSAVPQGLSPQLTYGVSRTAFVGGSYAFK